MSIFSLYSSLPPKILASKPQTKPSRLDHKWTHISLWTIIFTVLKITRASYMSPILFFRCLNSGHKYFGKIIERTRKSVEWQKWLSSLCLLSLDLEQSLNLKFDLRTTLNNYTLWVCHKLISQICLSKKIS
jgi:hypothetical protein